MFIQHLKLELLLLCLSLGTTVLGQTPAREAKPHNCSLSGRVTIDGKPAANATITVMPAGADNPQAVALGQVENFYAKAVTDGEGRYQFFNLPPGHLLVRAFSKAYVSKGQSQSGFDSEEQRQGGRMVTLVAGEQRADCDFEVVRGGVITGRITEEGGKPVTNEHINLLVLNKENQLNRAFYGSTNIQIGTDDRGIYRLFGLPAGRYLVCVGTGQFKQGGSNQSFSNSRYRLTFYPDAETPDKAKIIEVKEGSETTEIDLKLPRLKEGPAFTASGRVFDADTGDPIPYAGLSLMRTSEGAGGSLWHSPADARGNFRFEGLKRGHYVIRYYPLFGMEREEQPNYYSDQVKFELAGEEVNGLEVRLQRGATISGAVVVEGEEKGVDIALTIRKRTLLEGLTEQQQAEQSENVQQENASTKVGAGGQFRLVGARPGRFTFELFESGLGHKPLKLLRVERNGVNQGTRLEIGPHEQLTGLRVVAQRATGKLLGQVRFSGGALPPGFGMSVSVLSEDLLRRRESGEQVSYSSFDPDVGSATVDEAGNFLIEKLLPGSYKLWLSAHPLKAGNSAPPFEQVTQRLFVNAQGETAVTINVELGKKQ